MRKPVESLLLSRLLDLHLSRSIERLKDKPDMTTKFRELAQSIAQDRRNFDDQATELMARREDLRKRGELVFARHRENLDDVMSGLDAMESALNDLEGSNSKNGEGSGGTSDTFQRSGDGEKQA